MGKNKKGHNWKARQQVKTVVDRGEEEKIQTDLSDIKTEGIDESNALVLPSRKRKTTKIDEEGSKVRILSKKQRKRLEKIVEKKQKKTQRASILESLAKVQASQDELALFTSTSSLHSRKTNDKIAIQQSPSGEVRISSVSGSNKKTRKPPLEIPGKEEESDESDVHTSDMSTDEEEEQTTVKDDESSEQTSKMDELSSQQICDKTSDKEKKETEDKDLKTSKSKSNEKYNSNRTLKESTKCVNKEDTKPAVHVALNRKPELQEGRLKLPILGEEQEIMESINENPVVILCGETGSGKTTQVPQFLYEAGYTSKGLIGVTEPRRVAAISMSHRVAEEMNVSRNIVSYQIRYEGNVTEETKIKFMTDGVLLKEIQKDFLLMHYSVIIIDEAHERSVYTDILIGLLSRIVPLRQKRGMPLKLIIMSATLRVEDFTENKRLFKVTPPVIKVESRQFPVTIHFNKRTPLEDYLGEAYKKVCKIHRMLPEGGILVFVTGQQEVHTLCKKLRKTFPQTGKGNIKEKDDDNDDPSSLKKLPKFSLDSYSALPVDEEAELETADDQSDEELSDAAEMQDDDDMDDSAATQASDAMMPLYVLPLYSLLASDRQAKVFQPPPEGSRLCVVATNVAETSLTIPNIKYVVDTGKVKTKFYDKITGVSTFQITWTSQASSNQRAGRAGRTGPGHCYRLFSSAVFNDDFEKFSPPEITRRPVEDLILQMKDMNIDKVINFPFPTPPDEAALKSSEKLLVSLGALEEPLKPVRFKDIKKVELSTKITPLGKAMACFPVSPRYGKMLSLGHQHQLLPYVISIVSALSVQDVFIDVNRSQHTEEEKDEHQQNVQRITQLRKTWAGSGNSLLLGDLMVLLKAVGSCEYAGCTPGFCERHGVRYKAMMEIRKLRAQLTNTVNSVIPDANIYLDSKMAPPSDLHAKLLRQIALSGLGDRIARSVPDMPSGKDDGKKLKHAFQCLDLEEPVFIHPSSVLYKQKVDYVIYQEIAETSKLYMKGVTAIEPQWLPVFVPHYCTFSKPLEDPPPRYSEETGTVVCHMTSTFGRCSWQLPAVELDYPAGLDRFKWFARFFLEGQVVSELQKYKPLLLSTPSTMIKSWAKLQPRTETLLQAFISNSVDSRESLLKAWDKDKSYLLEAYLEWVPQAKHEQIKAKWPPR